MPFTQMVNGTLKRHHNSNSKSKWTVYRENKFYNALIIVENIGFYQSNHKFTISIEIISFSPVLITS